MEKKNLDWANLGFGYMTTDYRYVANYKDGAWDKGGLTDDPTVTLNECAGIFHYCQEIFEGLKAYTTEDGHIVTFRPDLNAVRMMDSAKRLEMPPFPAERFLEAVEEVVKANAAWVPPYGSGASLYVRPYMFGSNPVIGVKPADEYQFRILTTPVGPYFKGGAKPITIRVSDFDRAAPHGTGHIKAGLNYAMSLHAIVSAHKEGYDENMYLDPGTRTKVEETGGANFLFVTKDGKVFKIIKFRSMKVDADADRGGEAHSATVDDDRITPVGRVIRACRMDEFPQIFNILKGDMSVVGPRPECVENVERYLQEVPEFAYRHKVKAGLTGYAQIYGKYNTTAYDKLKLDLFYIENYSIRTDLRLIFMTVKVLFMKESTEGFDET